MEAKMKKNYINPEVVEIELSQSTVICQSYAAGIEAFTDNPENTFVW